MTTDAQQPDMVARPTQREYVDYVEQQRLDALALAERRRAADEARHAAERAAQEALAAHYDPIAADIHDTTLAELRESRAALIAELPAAQAALDAARAALRGGNVKMLGKATAAQTAVITLEETIRDLDAQIVQAEAEQADALATAERRARIEALRTLANELAAAPVAYDQQLMALRDELLARVGQIGAQRAAYRALRALYHPIAQQLGAATLHSSSPFNEHVADEHVLAELRGAGVDVDALNRVIPLDRLGPYDRYLEAGVGADVATWAGRVGHFVFELAALGDGAPAEASQS